MNIGSNTNFATNGGKTNPLNNPIVAGDLTTKDIIDMLLTSASKSFSGDAINLYCEFWWNPGETLNHDINGPIKIGA